MVDPYRWMETSTDDLMAYMKAENAVTVQALQPFATQDAQILAELTKLSDTVDIVSNPDRAFWIGFSTLNCLPAKAITS